MPTPAPQAPQPGEQLVQLAVGYMASRALQIAAELALADHLASGPKSAADLARATGVKAEPLYRMMRALASAGVFTETASGTFALTPVGELLRSDVPGSLRDTVIWIGDAFHYRIYAELDHSIRTGEPAADKVLGMPVFDYFAKDEAEAAVFNRAMTSFSSAIIPPVLEAYDFSGIATLLDVGGGHGQLLISILQRYPQMRGIVYDLESVVAGARPRLEQFGVAGRCQSVSGSFFESVPAGADAVIMKHIIHDWDDEKSTTILRNCHRVLAPGARLILLEGVVPEGDTPHFAKFLDLEMMIFPGGKERTEAEFRDLLANAGFTGMRVIPVKGPLVVIEARRQ